MNQISEEEAKRLLEEGKEEIKKILNEGGKITDTIIREKDKTTTIRKIELANGKSNSFKVIQTKDEINIENATRYKLIERKWLYVDYEKINQVLMKILEKKYDIKIEAKVERKWVPMKNILKGLRFFTIVIGTVLGVTAIVSTIAEFITMNMIMPIVYVILGLSLIYIMKD